MIFSDLVTGFYKDYGVGMFGLNKAFRIAENGDGTVRFLPINNMDAVMLDDLIGYETSEEAARGEYACLCRGARRPTMCCCSATAAPANPPASRPIVNEFYPMGLRMIEIYKHQFKDLSTIIGQIKNRNYQASLFIWMICPFEEFEIEYKFLKAVIEGGVETKPDNILIYATSNRRHLIQ